MPGFPWEIHLKLLKLIAQREAWRPEVRYFLVA